jgi:hypothetical protein
MFILSVSNTTRQQVKECEVIDMLFYYEYDKATSERMRSCSVDVILNSVRKYGQSGAAERKQS